LRVVLVAVAFLGVPSAAAQAPAPPDLAPCDLQPPPPRPTAAEQRYLTGIDFRKSKTMPHTRADVERAERHPRRRRPMEANGAALTPREYAYLVDRRRVQEGASAIGRYERRFPATAGGTSIEDDYPRGAYVAVRFTRDLARHRAALRRIARVRFKVVRVAYSERELARLQDRISDDDRALARLGIHPTALFVDVTRNRVEVEATSPRPDARAVFARRYGRRARLVVVAKERYRSECQHLDGYTLPQPAQLRLRWGNSGSVDFERTVLREEPDRVIVGVIVRVPQGFLTADLSIRETVVDLGAPLGTRQVVDASTGRPLRTPPPDPFGPGG
jgi:hypothetical protein